MDAAQTVEQTVEGLDLRRAIRLLTGSAQFDLHRDDEIGLESLAFSDGPMGVRGRTFLSGPTAALLPCSALLAASWDPDLVGAAGDLLAAEARSQGVHVVLGPAVNLHRTPLAGRLFETFSEDPLLTGVMAAAYVRGLQAAGVGACVKHFVANEAETERRTVDSRVSARALRELYLLPFEICVEDADPWLIMAAYNTVNGVPATEQDELLNGVLKHEWGWPGVVVSDWLATRSTVAAARGGLDLVMPGPGGPWGDQLVTAVRTGAVPDDVIREHLRRLLRLAARVGVWGSPDSGVVPMPDIGCRSDPAVQLRGMAAAGMTVLRNEDAVLPADPAVFNAAAPLVVIGAHAEATLVQGGGSALVRPHRQVSVAEGLRTALGEQAVHILPGVGVRHRPLPAESGLASDPETGTPGIRITSRDSGGAELASTVNSRAQVLLGMGESPHDGADVIEFAADWNASGVDRLEVGVRGAGQWTLDVDGARHEIILGASAGRDEGLLDPPWRTIQIPGRRALRIVARMATDPGAALLVELIAHPVPRPDAAIIDAASEAACDAPLAVIVVGLTDEQETEGTDKHTLALPGAQDDMVRAVAAAAQRTIVIVNAATPVLMPWIDAVDAVLWIGLPGQEAGHAVADVLLGHREATGRLVTTFPHDDGDGPAWSPVPTGGVLHYAEDLAVGYRGWAEGSSEPLYWFGHGLGWASWEYRSARHDVDRDGQESVAVEVVNTAHRRSREVVQIYLQVRGEPIRLVGWSSVHVEPGATIEVDVPLDHRAMRVWGPDGWRPLDGGTLVVARGLGDRRLTVPRRYPH